MNLISLSSVLRIVFESIRYPHKLPEPLHLAHKIARKKAQTTGDSRPTPTTTGGT